VEMTEMLNRAEGRSMSRSELKRYNALEAQTISASEQLDRIERDMAAPGETPFGSLDPRMAQDGWAPSVSRRGRGAAPGAADDRRGVPT